MTRKRKRLIIGDRIMILAPPRKRGPVRIDRSVPIDYETYLQQRDERRLEAERSAHFEAMRSTPSGQHDTVVITDLDRDDDLDVDDGEHNNAEEPQP